MCIFPDDLGESEAEDFTMGGYGSGYRCGGKTTVERCLSMSAVKLMQDGSFQPNVSHFGASLSWRNTLTGERRGGIGYESDCNDDSGTMRLRYTRGDESLDYRVRVTTTRTAWGALRWWFACPLRGCGRRAGKLYLPPGRRHFGCRRCHDLTYKSCQESHKFDRCFDRIGASMGLSAQAVASLLKGKW